MIPPETRLRRALHHHSLSLVRRVVLSQPSPAQFMRNPDPSDDGNTSLHITAKLGLYDVATFLITHGHEDAGISRNHAGTTPLMVAAQAGDNTDDPTTTARIEVAKLLIAHFPTAAGIRDAHGLDAFAHAARSGCTPLLAHLLALPSALANPFPYPDPNFNPTSASSTDILLAARDGAGNTPLHHASAAGHLKTQRLLVQAGADVGAENDAGWTPLDYAARVSAEVYLRGLLRDVQGLREKESDESKMNRARGRGGGIRVVEGDVEGGG